MNLPFNQAADNNKQVILDILKPLAKNNDKLLEIGSGTGQHMVHFAKHMPEVSFQPSDRHENLAGIKARIEQSKLTNISSPIELDVNERKLWPAPTNFTLIYSANTSHIMAWQEVELMLELVAACLKPQGKFILYGPFNDNGDFTSESNQSFDAFLKQQAPHMGLRDKQAIIKTCLLHNLQLINTHTMPRNNLMMCFG